MSYKEFYQDSNEQTMERYLLAKERIAEIKKKPEVPALYQPFFSSLAAKYDALISILQAKEEGTFQQWSLEKLQQENAAFYQEWKQEYDTSYSNPAYSVSIYGESLGRLFSMLYAGVLSLRGDAFREDYQKVTIALELLVEIYNLLEEEQREAEEFSQELDLAAVYEEMEQAVYWHYHDYSEIFMEQSVRQLVNPKEDFLTEIVLQWDLSDLRYLYQYGDYIGENEEKVAAFLNACSQEQVQAMADTFTEGYRIGFAVTGKDISLKKTVQIRYPIGFERMVAVAIHNFQGILLKPTMTASGTEVNPQFTFDHKEDMALYLNKSYVERRLEVLKMAYEQEKEQAGVFGGPAVIEVFGETPFSPESKPEALHFSEKQQQLMVYLQSMAGQLVNQYIKGEERSFTIIAYPLPEIGPRFPEIFAETVKINTLDYQLYQKMQQKMVDVLDQAKTVHITGKGANRTDLYVKIYPLKDPQKETAFENCVADVNIPVGEVFTSPVLEGTTGTLFVSQVYLNGLSYQNLELTFTDGMVSDYTCSNFSTEEENKKYIKDNVLMHHDTLPMGEFAIGTNTTAYRMARTYGIAERLPILIAEKTGPHFAVGDTCYSHEEDLHSANPDGKAIVARENTISALRSSDCSKAYFNCHTDITIPYDELDRITVMKEDGSATDIIADGRFVLPGTEVLNEPLDEM